MEHQVTETKVDDNKSQRQISIVTIMAEVSLRSLITAAVYHPALLIYNDFHNILNIVIIEPDYRCSFSHGLPHYNLSDCHYISYH